MQSFMLFFLFAGHCCIVQIADSTSAICAFSLDLAKEIVKNLDAALKEDFRVAGDVAVRITPLALKENQISQLRCDAATNELQEIQITMEFEATLMEKDGRATHKAAIDAESIIRLLAGGKPRCNFGAYSIVANEAGCDEDPTCKERLRKFKKAVPEKTLVMLVQSRLESQTWSGWIAENKFIETTSAKPMEAQKKQGDAVINILKTKASEIPCHAFLQEAIPKAQWKAVYAANGDGVTVRTESRVRELYFAIVIATNCKAKVAFTVAELGHEQYITVSRLEESLGMLIARNLPKQNR